MCVMIPLFDLNRLLLRFDLNLVNWFIFVCYGVLHGHVCPTIALKIINNNK